MKDNKGEKTVIEEKDENKAKVIKTAIKQATKRADSDKSVQTEQFLRKQEVRGTNRGQDDAGSRTKQGRQVVTGPSDEALELSMTRKKAQWRWTW